MPNHYATAGELGYNGNSKKFLTLQNMVNNDRDNQLLLQMAEKEVYLTPKEQESLWQVTNPSQLSELLSSKREKIMGKEFCSKKKTTDDWSRPADINSILYYSCPGDDPNIAITRENKVSRSAYDEDYAFPRTVPLGLQI